MGWGSGIGFLWISGPQPKGKQAPDPGSATLIFFIYIHEKKNLRRWAFLFIESGLASGPLLWIRVSDPDPHGSALIWVAGSGSIQIADLDPGGQKLHTKIEKRHRIVMFWSAGCSLLRAEGFFCSLGVLYGGLGISKLQFLIKKIKIKFLAVNFLNFRSSNPDPQLEQMLDPDPDPH